MQTINSKTQKFCKNEFLMIKNYNPDNRYYGLPEYVSCLPAILFDREMMEYNIARIQNNAIPDLIVTVSGTQLTQAQKDTMKDFWSGNFKGIKNSGKTLLIETNAKDSQIQVTEIKSTYRDGAFRLAKRECRDEIIACHGVPPVLLGIKTSGTIGSGKDITEQVRTFKEIIIEPRQRRLEHLFNSFFCKELAIDKIEILFKNINLIELINGKENK
jgi:Bacteriophage capsid portal protein